MGARAPLSAAVLAGGQSRRMGIDKALLRLREGDPPLLALVLDRLTAVADDVFVVATARPEYSAFGVPVWPDDAPGEGTLGGILTAIRRASHKHCLVVACDMPFLNPPFLRWMAGQPRDYDVLIPRIPGESRQGSGLVWQTLHAIYGKGCEEPIVRCLEAGQRRVIGFFPDVRVRPIEAATAATFDPSFATFFNANTPEALAEAQRRSAALAGDDERPILADPGGPR